MPLPVLTIVLPVHNGERYIAAAIGSVQAQHFADWELIVVDDGSTDATADVVARHDDRRVQYVRQGQRGPSAARNTGVARARGAYLAFLDADDLFHPAKLARQVARLEDEPHVGLSYGAHVEIDAEGRPLQLVSGPPMADIEALAGGWPFDVDDFVVRREWFDSVGGFDARLRVNEDRDLFLRLALAGCRMKAERGCLSYRRLQRSPGMSDARSKLATALQVLRRAFADSRCPLPVARAGRAAYARVYLGWACGAYVREAIPEAQRCLTMAVRLDPSLVEAGAQALVVALVDASIRYPEDHDARLRIMLRHLPAELDWIAAQEHHAVGAAFLRCGTRELLWGRAASGRDQLSRAAAAGIAPDEAYCREAAAQLIMHEAEFGDAAARRSLDALCDGVGGAWTTAAARALRRQYLIARAFDFYASGRHARVPRAVAQAVAADRASLRHPGLAAITARAVGHVMRDRLPRPAGAARGRG